MTDEPKYSPSSSRDLWQACGCWVRSYKVIDDYRSAGWLGTRNMHYRSGWRDWGWGQGMVLHCDKHRPSDIDHLGNKS